MVIKLKELIKHASLEHKSINREKIRFMCKKFLGLSYKDKVKIPLKKTTKSHHRLRTTWILQFLTYSYQWNGRNIISIDETD